MKKLLLTLVITLSIFGGSVAAIEGLVEGNSTIELSDQRPPV